MSKSALVLSCVAALGLGGGMAAVASDHGAGQPAAGLSSSRQGLLPDDATADEVTGVWPKNQFGLTYGYATPADIDAGNIPDLRPFQPTPDGPGGFLRNDESYLTEAATTEEEIARTKAMYDEQGREVRNLYGPDGTTVLDTFVYSTISMADEDGQTLNPKTGEPIDSE